MPCDNCRATADPAFTLAAHPNDGEAVIVDFCSIDCLQTWTSGEGTDFGRWRWGAYEDAIRDPPASPAD